LDEPKDFQKIRDLKGLLAESWQGEGLQRTHDQKVICGAPRFVADEEIHGEIAFLDLRQN
jgi:hypothetical protein